jgi:hypothetical protein
MKIYAIDTAVIEEEPIVESIYEDTKDIEDTEDYLPIQDYDEWEDYVTEYKPAMIPEKEYKGRTFAEYLSYREKVNNYCDTHFDQSTVDKVIDLYRQLIPMKYIGEKLGINAAYISALLRNNMPIDEFREIRAKIKHILAVQFRSRGKSMERIEEEKKMPLLVWKAYYVQKKPFEQVAKELKITYERLTRILNAIKVSLAPQVSQF